MSFKVDYKVVPQAVLQHASRLLQVSEEGVYYAMTQTRIKAKVENTAQWDNSNKRWTGDVRQFAAAFDTGHAHAPQELTMNAPAETDALDEFLK